MRAGLVFGAMLALAGCGGSADTAEGTAQGTAQTADDVRNAHHCVQTELCTSTGHWDHTLCRCVPNHCVDNVLCIRGDHWDSTQCRCVPNHCVDNVLCIRGDHWDSTQCRCVPDAPGACTSASECSGALPHFCRICSDGTSSCAHWACVSGRCEIATCQ